MRAQQRIRVVGLCRVSRTRLRAAAALKLSSAQVEYASVSSLSASDRLREPSERLARSDRFRILSIDGGGIRGIIPAVFLDRLEELLKAELDNARAQQSKTEITARWEGVTEPRIADCFHLIAGTSTGGLLAAGLTVTAEDGRPKLSAAETP